MSTIIPKAQTTHPSSKVRKAAMTGLEHHHFLVYVAERMMHGVDRHETCFAAAEYQEVMDLGKLSQPHT